MHDLFSPFIVLALSLRVNTGTFDVAKVRKFPDIQTTKNQLITNLTELFDSELREARLCRQSQVWPRRYWAMPSAAFGASPTLPQTALPELKSRLNTECLKRQERVAPQASLYLLLSFQPLRVLTPPPSFVV